MIPMATDADTTAAPDAGRLAGRTLEAIRDRCRQDLEEYAEFQHKYVVDRQYGGYTLHTDWDGPPLDYDKRTWYEGRGTWTFCFLYNRIDPDPRHLHAARASIDFVLRHRPDVDAFLPARFTREGEPGNPERDLYGDIFVANGLAEFSKAEGNEEYYDIAREIVLKCVRIYDTPGYGASELAPQGSRWLGHWFILLRIATQMLESRSDPAIESLAERCIEAQMNYHYHTDFGLYNEQINHDLSRPDNELAQRGSIGHASEMLWMTMAEAVRRADRTLFDENAMRLRRNLEVAWDDVYGGVFHNLEHVDENRFVLNKTAWGQMEHLIGLLMIIEHTGAQWARDWYARLYTWVMERFPLRPHGLPLWQDGTNRRAVFIRGNNGRRAENLHYPRYLMLSLLALNRMVERGGEIADVFAASGPNRTG
jgi:N-acylglucosamine 2-epimerase